MKWYVGILVMLLVAPTVIAVSTTTIIPPNQQQTTIIPPSQQDALPGLAEGNRFLAAEVSREMRDAKDEIITSVKSYQDENFQIFDVRMTTFMTETKTKVALGAIGAALIANAIVALILFRVTRNYSYEKYLEGRLANFKDSGDTRPLSPGMANMQQPTWNDQVPNQTMGMIYGQEAAAQMTQMNAWQAQPAYQGAWQPPLEVEPEYNRTPGGHYRADSNDPMDSPGWNPGGN